jgi:hypothetical protein
MYFVKHNVTYYVLQNGGAVGKAINRGKLTSVRMEPLGMASTCNNYLKRAD